MFVVRLITDTSHTQHLVTHQTKNNCHSTENFIEIGTHKHRLADDF